MTEIEGEVAAGFERGARRVRGQLRRATARSAPRSASTSGARRSSTSGAASPTPTTGRPWTRGHPAARLLDDQGRDRHLRPPARPARRARPRRAGRRATGRSSRPSGKDDIPVRWLLCHQAGLPTSTPTLTLDEVLAWDPIVEALAAQAPLLGAGHGPRLPRRHLRLARRRGRAPGRRAQPRARSSPTRSPRRSGSTSGSGCPSPRSTASAGSSPMQVGGSPERADARSLPEEIRELIAAAHATRGRCMQRALTVLAAGRTRLQQPARCTPPRSRPPTASPPPARWPACTPHASARSTASACSTPTTVGGRHRRRSERPRQGADGRRPASGSGFFLAVDVLAAAAARASFGHAGAGGSVGFADPDRQIGFGYVMNKMQQNLSGDPRTLGLVDAVNACVG